MARKIVWSDHAYLRGYQRSIPYIRHEDIYEAAKNVPKLFRGKVTVDGHVLVIKKTHTKILIITAYPLKETSSNKFNSNLRKEV